MTKLITVLGGSESEADTIMKRGKGLKAEAIQPILKRRQFRSGTVEGYHCFLR